VFTTSNNFYLYLVFSIYLAAWGVTLGRRLRSGLVLLGVGILVHGAYLLGRGWLGGVFIANPVVEGPFFIPFCLAIMACIGGVLNYDGNWKNILPLVLFFTLLSIGYAKGMIPPTPKKLSVWALLFFISESIAYACFYIGAVYAALSLAERNGSGLFRPFIVWGFVAYTISQVTGAVWSYVGWGNTFNWSPRHLSSASIWMLYLAILHIKYISGWSIKRETLLSVISGVYLFIVSYLHFLKEMDFPRIGG
jgi:hypothetical protein